MLEAPGREKWKLFPGVVVIVENQCVVVVFPFFFCLVVFDAAEGIHSVELISSRLQNLCQQFTNSFMLRVFES